MNLSNKEKKVVENEILYRIGSGRIPTKIVIDDVFSGNSIPGCKKCNISGIISGMEKRNMIHCSGGFCW